MILPLQQTPASVIEQKLAHAPNEGYAVGVMIGNLLPFTVLAIFAYLLYSYYKNKNSQTKNENLLDD